MGSFETLQSPFPTPTIHITTHNAKAQATVHESRQGDTLEYPQQKCVLVNVYASDQQPPELTEDADLHRAKAILGQGKIPIVQADGSVARFVDIAPGNVPMMHQTQSLDYLVLLEGTLIMELDDGSETLIKTGDTVIQRATMHAWRNPSETKWARLFVVLQDIRPLKVNGKEIHENLGNGAGHFGAKHT